MVKCGVCVSFRKNSIICVFLHILTAYTHKRNKLTVKIGAVFFRIRFVIVLVSVDILGMIGVFVIFGMLDIVDMLAAFVVFSLSRFRSVFLLEKIGECHSVKLRIVKNIVHIRLFIKRVFSFF